MSPSFQPKDICGQETPEAKAEPGIARSATARTTKEHLTENYIGNCREHLSNLKFQVFDPPSFPSAACKTAEDSPHMRNNLEAD
jgi:hypothetical protein